MKLIKIDDNTMRLVTDNTSIEGTKEFILKYMREDEGVALDDLLFALEEMWINRHDTAHFGINRFFTHTTSSMQERNLATELAAIESVRAEFELAASMGVTGIELFEIHTRLNNLYASLNVSRILKVLNLKEQMSA